jgi:lyso-ornithine lipid O-acyltransferase
VPYFIVIADNRPWTTCVLRKIEWRSEHSMRKFFKLPGILFLLTLYIIFACFIALLPTGAKIRRALLIKNTSRGSRLMLRLLGVRVHVKHGERLLESEVARLVVANHLSYIDVLVIASVVPSLFITSVELGSTPVLGMLARLGGSIFVERRKATKLRQEIPIISHALRSGLRVTLFPEGTTSNGRRVQPFKNSLFHAAILAQTDIQPLCLRYIGVNGKPLNEHNCDSVFYYGGATFFRHFPRLLSLTSIDVEIVPLKIILFREKVTRKELAIRTHEVISAAYHDEFSRDLN